MSKPLAAVFLLLLLGANALLCLNLASTRQQMAGLRERLDAVESQTNGIRKALCAPINAWEVELGLFVRREGPDKVRFGDRLPYYLVRPPTLAELKYRIEDISKEVDGIRGLPSFSALDELAAKANPKPSLKSLSEQLDKLTTLLDKK